MVPRYFENALAFEKCSGIEQIRAWLRAGWSKFVDGVDDLIKRIHQSE